MHTGFYVHSISILCLFYTMLPEEVFEPNDVVETLVAHFLKSQAVKLELFFN